MGRLGISLDTIAGAIQSIGVAIILWCGFTLMFNNSLSLGTLITFYALLGYFIEPGKNLIVLQPVLQTASVAALRLSDILDSAIESDTNKSSTVPAVRCWEAKNVDFRYGNNELTLKYVSISVEAGTHEEFKKESGKYAELLNNQ